MPGCDVTRDIEVREATVVDAAAIARVRVLGWQTAYRGLVDDEFLDAMSVEEDTATWADRLGTVTAGGSRTLVALAGDRDVVGWCTYGPRRIPDYAPDPAALAEPASVGEVYACYVDPTSWGAGVGDALMATALSGLAADGYARATLWVLEDNRRARRFYARHGWTPGPGRITVPVPGAPWEVELRRDIR